jgi:hypothetical protein
VSRIASTPVALEVPPPDALAPVEFDVGAPGVLVSEHPNVVATIATATANENDCDKRIT